MDNGQEEEKEIYDELDYPLHEGDTWYLIDSKWLENWKSYVGITKSKGEPPGPIDNSNLLEDNLNKLKKKLIENHDYESIPESVWNKLAQKYGLVQGQNSIGRKVIETGKYTKSIQIELYPPEIRLQQHSDQTECEDEMFSRSATIEEIHKFMRELFEIPDNRETRVYLKERPEPIDEKKTLDDLSIITGQTLVLETKNDDGSWPRPPSYNESQAIASTSSKTKQYNTSSTYSMNGINNYPSQNLRSRADYNSFLVPPGLCGLSNLGNTCFMNSAIQCLSNVPSLTKYFEQNKYVDELNYENPLGMHGKIANAYAELIKDVWSGHHSSVSPREFKYNVSSFAPRFSGYQQHDSQELLAFLIDGLHEDLNRIKKKPYIELQDSNGRDDTIVAREAWLNHRERNDSIIVDTFHGLFKSTLVCPESSCQRISITFDPFGFLSLPLPISNNLSIICHYVPCDPAKRIVKHRLSVRKDGCMRHVCEALAERVGSKAQNLCITDVYNYRFYKVYTGSEKVSGYSDRDNLFIFDKGQTSDDHSEEDIVFVRVLMRRDGNVAKKLFGQPFLIPVKSKSTTYRTLYNAVLKAVSRYVKEEFRDNIKMLSELQKCDINESDEGTDVDNLDKKEQSDTEGEEEEAEEQLFTLGVVNSFGTTNLKNLECGDTLLHISGDMYFSADWEQSVLEEYMDEDVMSVIEDDSSVDMNPRKGKHISLRDCMNLFTTKEQLGEHDPWYCPDCKEHKQATKKFDLWSLPPVLIIHLKRFSYSRWSRDKISTMVDFPLKDFDMSEFIINPAKQQWPKEKKTYNLIAVSNHYGGMGGGHYTAYARNYKDDKWYHFDDSSVSAFSEDRVKTQAAYMLLYQRQDLEEWVKTGSEENFNFLESLVSPRSCDPAHGFTYSEKSNENNLQRKHTCNGNASISDQEPVKMDTS